MTFDTNNYFEMVLQYINNNKSEIKLNEITFKSKQQNDKKENYKFYC